MGHGRCYKRPVFRTVGGRLRRKCMPHSTTSPMVRHYLSPNATGQGFPGLWFVFGELVYAMPSGLHRKRNLKFEPLLGYLIQDGGKCFGKYQWAFLDELAGQPLFNCAR